MSWSLLRQLNVIKIMSSQELGCAAGAGQLAAMRALPAQALVAKTFASAANDCYEPAIDRRSSSVKPWSSVEALREGRFQKVPVLLGVTDHDGLGKVRLTSKTTHTGSKKRL